MREHLKLAENVFLVELVRLGEALSLDVSSHGVAQTGSPSNWKSQAADIKYLFLFKVLIWNAKCKFNFHVWKNKAPMMLNEKQTSSLFGELLQVKNSLAKLWIWCKQHSKIVQRTSLQFYSKNKQRKMFIGWNKQSFTVFVCGRPCHLSSLKHCSGTIFSSKNSLFIHSWRYIFIISSLIV